MTAVVTWPEHRFEVPTDVEDANTYGRVHCIAVGGVGVSAVARLLHQRGLSVSGSDGVGSPVLDALSAEGITTYVGHDAAHVAHLGPADTVVVSSAVREDNIELATARRAGVRVRHRSAALAAALADRRRIAVAGANGKTTTCAMLVSVLAAAGLEPSFAIGAELTDRHTNAALGAELAVIEADESDGSFLAYAPEAAIVTSVQPDHLDYFQTADNVAAAYRQLVCTLRPGATLVVCADDPGARTLGELAQSEPTLDLVVLSYGGGAGTDATLGPTRSLGTGLATTTPVVLSRPDGPLALDLRLPVPGRFNAYNAAAVLMLAAARFGVDPATALQGLAGYAGTRRRFERVGSAGGVDVVDDYAHNPAKVAAVVEAGQAVATGRGGRLAVMFQPHLYTRTRDFAQAFGAALGSLRPEDLVVVLPIYGAREDPLPGVTSALVADAITGQGPTVYLADAAEDAIDTVVAFARPDDVCLTVGAGDVTRLGPRLLTRLGAT